MYTTDYSTVRLSVSRLTRLPTQHLSACLSACLPVFLRTSASVCADLSACLYVCLRVCLSVSVPADLPAKRLPACLAESASLPVVCLSA